MGGGHCARSEIHSLFTASSVAAPCTATLPNDIQWRNATRNGPESVPATEASRQVGGSTCWKHANAARNAPQRRHQLLKHRARSEAPRAGSMQMPREMQPESALSCQVGGSTCWEHANTLRNRSGAPRAGSRAGTGINQFAETD